MHRKGVFCLMVGASLLLALGWSWNGSRTPAAQAAGSATPADGYVVHVTAPLFVNGQVMGPFHHFKSSFSAACFSRTVNAPYTACHPDRRAAGFAARSGGIVATLIHSSIDEIMPTPIPQEGTRL